MRDLLSIALQGLAVTALMIATIAFGIGTGWLAWRYIHPIAGVIVGVLVFGALTPVGWTLAYEIGYRWG